MKALLWGLWFAVLAGFASAQQAPETGEGARAGQAAAPIFLTVDVDRLFAQTEFGERIAREYTEGQAQLSAENRRIAEALREEELALTEARAVMAVDVFRAEAEAFDERAQGIRRAQDAKERALEDILAQGRNQFLDVSRPILGQLMIERGAIAILDRRSILLSLGSIDVTDDAIARINAAIGDGTGQDTGASPQTPDLAPAPEPTPEPDQTDSAPEN